jgi:hypothetical protein
LSNLERRQIDEKSLPDVVVVNATGDVIKRQVPDVTVAAVVFFNRRSVIALSAKFV